MSQYRVLCCGSNGNFQLGISDDEDKDKLTAAKFKINNSITTKIFSAPIKIACGGNHSFILLDNGDLYSCGDNSKGQCGHSKKNPTIKEFTKIEGSDWKHIACGWEYSILIKCSGDIYVCGAGAKGELGLGPNVLETELKRLEFSPSKNIVELKAAVNHTIVRLSDDTLYGWGNSRKGQLGIHEKTPNNKPRAVVWEPELLNFENKNKDYQNFDLGREFTAFGFDDGVKIFGKTSENYKQDNILDLQTMWSSYHLLYKDDEKILIKSRGNNSHGQLFPKTNLNIKSYSIGSEHGLIETEDNKVYAWGWGEHGNCGVIASNSSDLQEQVTFRNLNLIYNGEDPVYLTGCGCATSWIILRSM